MLILQYYVGMVDDGDINLAASDLNGDGRVNSLDAMLILQYYVGIIVRFPVEG